MNSRIANSTVVAESEAPNLGSQAGALAVWGGTIFLSAFLLFQVQPVLAKIILPWFGGGAGVWTTSLVFFQVTYLLGNFYAHGLMRLRNPLWSSRIHVALLAASLLLLPILPGASWKPAESADPALRIFALLAVKIGLPFFLLSATSPLLQAPGRTPYFDERDSLAVHSQISALLDRWHGSKVDRAARLNFRSYRYFGVSALGETPTGDNRVSARGVRPYRVTDPLLWLLGQFGVIPVKRG